MNVYFAGLNTKRVLHEQVAVSKNKKTHIISIDFNNSISGMYSESAILEFVNDVSANKKLTPAYGILHQILDTLLFMLSQSVDARFFIHIETGQSQYHLSIQKDYKERRGGFVSIPQEVLDQWYTYHKLLREVVTEFVSKLPYVHVATPTYLEADFLPYYLLYKRMLPYIFSTKPSSGGAEEMDAFALYIYSTDRDLYQTLRFKHCIEQVRPSYAIKDDRKKYVREPDILYALCGRDFPDITPELASKFLPFIMAWCGDAGDNVSGIPRMGYVTATKAVDYLIKKAVTSNKLEQIVHSLDHYRHATDLDELYRVNILPYVPVSVCKELSSNLDLVIRNHRLIDFRVIINDLGLKDIQGLDRIFSNISASNKSQTVLTDNDFRAFVTEIIVHDNILVESLVRKYLLLLDYYAKKGYSSEM